MIALDRAPAFDDDRRQRVGDRAGSALGHGPADLMRERAEEEPVTRGHRCFERQHRVRGETADERGRLLGGEAPTDALRGTDSDESVTREQERMAGREVER